MHNVSISLVKAAGCRLGVFGSVPPPWAQSTSDEGGRRLLWPWGGWQPYQLGIWFLDLHLDLLFICHYNKATNPVA